MRDVLYMGVILISILVAGPWYCLWVRLYIVVGQQLLDLCLSARTRP